MPVTTLELSLECLAFTNSLPVSFLGASLWQSILFLLFFYADTNGGVTNGGSMGVWPPFLEISRKGPFSAFLARCRTARRAPGKSRKHRICLNPHLLKPHLRHSNCFSMLTCFHADFGKECPSIFGEVHPETAPLQARCCPPCSTEQSSRQGERKKRGNRCKEKERKRGGQERRQKGKKDA